MFVVVGVGLVVVGGGVETLGLLGWLEVAVFVVEIIVFGVVGGVVWVVA